MVGKGGCPGKEGRRGGCTGDWSSGDWVLLLGEWVLILVRLGSRKDVVVGFASFRWDFQRALCCLCLLLVESTDIPEICCPFLA